MELNEWKQKNQKPRNYAHFDDKLSLNHVWNYISNAQNIEKHSFYPFIHYIQTFNKYSKEKGIKPKERELCYSSHIDRYIYQYYGYMLNLTYNEFTAENGLDNVAIAYRDNLGKNNIHFAKYAIDFIREKKECYIIIGDFTKFFDSLNHIYLKKCYVLY